MHQGKEIFLVLGFSMMLLFNTVTGSFPTAENVSWSSINFKTLLSWSPKPVNYSYTVEFSALGQNRKRSPYCIQTSETECDLTQQLTNIKETYTADVLSEPVRGATSDLVEFPYTRSTKFCPYTDTIIGKPDFDFTVSKDGRTVSIRVIDPPTALFNEQNQPLNIRDVFGKDLEYRAMYRRAGSTGKKYQTSPTNDIELTRLDKGESYCIMVQAWIPSRGFGKEEGSLSKTKCTSVEPKGIGEYSPAVIAGAIVTILAIVITAIVVTVVCCRRRQKDVV
ncbi:hypothetical protein ACEWY4_018893 [Coilia grayii]|uniref:Tissue factor n=1 Tax=Coilia grayii TaxID=363190 RepID=A0ABD1JEH6_9TELE